MVGQSLLLEIAEINPDLCEAVEYQNILKNGSSDEAKKIAKKNLPTIIEKINGYEIRVITFLSDQIPTGMTISLNKKVNALEKKDLNSPLIKKFVSNYGAYREFAS